MLAVAFSISFSVIRIEPSTSPKISALVEIMLPTTRPFGPTTIFPLQLMSPSTCPSNLKSVSVIPQIFQDCLPLMVSLLPLQKLPETHP